MAEGKQTPRFKLTSSEEVPQLLLTPFIDVIFLITIFFVLTSAFSFLQVIKVDLPNSQTSQSDQPDALVVTLDAQGELWINQQKVSIESFGTVLDDLLKRNPELRSAVLNAWKQTELQNVIQVMDQIRLAGIPEIAVHTQDVP